MNRQQARVPVYGRQQGRSECRLLRPRPTSRWLSSIRLQPSGFLQIPVSTSPNRLLVLPNDGANDKAALSPLLLYKNKDKIKIKHGLLLFLLFHFFFFDLHLASRLRDHPAALPLLLLPALAHHHARLQQQRHRRSNYMHRQYQFLNSSFIPQCRPSSHSHKSSPRAHLVFPSSPQHPIGQALDDPAPLWQY